MKIFATICEPSALSARGKLSVPLMAFCVQLALLIYINTHTHIYMQRFVTSKETDVGRIKAEKMKYMSLFHEHNAGQNHNIKMGNES
jgi:hypothetical protein